MSAINNYGCIQLLIFFLVALDLADYIPLCRAITGGDWETAREHFSKDNNALNARLNVAGHRALHIAISATENIEFVKNLLKEINPDSLPSMVNNHGQNPLHYTAMVGNTAAAKMLVDRNPHLLFIPHRKEYLPIHRAVFGPHKFTFLYLLGSASTMFDVAFELIKEHPDMARTKYKDVDTPLMTIAGKLDLYYSGTRYNFYQRFVYSYVWIGNIFGNTDNDKVVSRCSLRMGLLSTLQIKRLKEDKVKHKEALTLLRHICEEVGKANKYNDMGEHYFKATNAAAVNDTPEAIEEMVMHFPQAI
ncbi:putative ankyrin repeat-containing domain-containing protein [Helianthus debilis subsp. tardiflorus]